MKKSSSSFWSQALVIFSCALLLVFVAFAAQAQPAAAANTATITFTAPTARTDGSAIAGTLSYKVYQGVKGQAKAVVGTISTTSSTINAGLLGGTEYCWQVSVTETIDPAVSGPESPLSNEDCKAFAAAGVTPVTITVR